MGEAKLKEIVTGRARRVTCRLCLESQVVEVETWDDRVEATFDHDCRSKGPRLSHPVTRDGTPATFFPVGERVLVQRIPPNTKVGMFFVPETHQKRQQFATVIAAGPKAQGILDDMGIKIGDTVTLGQYAGVSWEIPPSENIREARELDLINVHDIFGCQELAEKMIDGRLGIMLYAIPGKDGEQEYRFFEEVAKGVE